MIGLRTGLRVGTRVGLAVGLDADEKGVVAGYTGPMAGVNAYAAVKRPATTANWQDVASDIPAPQFLWTCQEASGNLVDLVAGFTLVAAGAVAYSQSVTDWTTSWVATTTETANQGFYAATGSGWNVDNDSLFVCGYSAVTNATAERVMFTPTATGPTSIWVSITAAGLLKINRTGTASGTGAVNFEAGTPAPFCWVLQYNKATSVIRIDAKKLGTAADSATCVYADHVDGAKGYNSALGGFVPPVARHNLCAAWTAANAETMSARGGASLGGATLISELGW